jgi:ABC-type oligopeptide transport system ATPase subunit
MAKLPPKRISNSLMNALRGGVVPREGAEYIAVGRTDELEAILHDIEILEEGGSTFRFIVGEFGSGKSFLFSIIRSHVTKKGFIVLDADLAPNRKLTGSKNEGLNLYRELIKNMSTQSCPNGGALSLILDKWINNFNLEARANKISEEDKREYILDRIYESCSSIRDMVHGFEFGKLLENYYISYEEGDSEKKDNVLKWLRGEYNLKREAKKDLGISIIITDHDWYDYIKLITSFSVQAGYKGVLMLCDEMINLSKISNKTARQNNFEKLLMLYNDTLQGKAHNLGIIMGATPRSLEDDRRGVFSYEALRSRLDKGSFASNEMKDLLSPILTIKKLNDSELFVLLERLSELHASLFGKNTIQENDIKQFLTSELSRVGAAEKLTPREIIRDFIEVMNLLLQNPDSSVESILNNKGFSYTKSLQEDSIDDEFTTFVV